MQQHINPNAPKRVPLCYMGGKFRIAEWVIGHFVEHSIYVEPFGGGASVLLKKKPSIVEVYNDRWDLVVNFFRVLRDEYEEFARLIALTPYSRTELELCKAGLLDEQIGDIERARRFFVWVRQSYNYLDGGNASLFKASQQKRTRDKPTSPPRSWRVKDDMWAIVQRLQNVAIENKDAIPLIKQYDQHNTLFYCDPPYPAETRVSSEYVHEMSNEDHAALLTQLMGIEGYALISTYPNDLYSDMLRGWQMVTKSNTTKSNKARTEALYISPRTWQALQETTPRLPGF